MTLFDRYEMHDIAQKVRYEAPNLVNNAYVNSVLRDLLERYAKGAGASYSASMSMTDNELIGVYRVGTKSPEAASRMADKIANAKGLATPIALPPVEPAPYVNGTPINGVSQDALDRAIAAVTDAVREGDAHTLECARDINASAHATLTDKLPGMIQDALKSVTPTRLDVKPLDKPVVPLGLVHKETARIIKVLARGSNVYLHGPAGSGKTTVAQKCADAFGLPLHCAAKVEDEFLLMGFRTGGTGEVVMTPFRLAYEFGGVFLFDELDRSASSAVTAMNMALANGYAPFPDGLVKRHKDFKCIGAGNTTLGGATHLYTAASQLDASSVDRFGFIEFGYDEDLEMAIAGDKAWCRFVQAVRAEVALRGWDKLVTPRATIEGSKGTLDGDTLEETADMWVYKGWPIEERNSVHRVVMAKLEG